MAKAGQLRRAVVQSSTLVQGGHYLTILVTEDRPKATISLRTHHQLPQGSRWSLKGDWFTGWSLAGPG